MDDNAAPPDDHPNPSPDVVLAALARAEDHTGAVAAPVPFWTLLEHLGVRPRTRLARQVRATLDALDARGLVERGRRHGVPVFSCTAAGRRRVRRLRSRDAPPALPESPQHLRWRVAREAAERELDRFRAELEAALGEARQLLAADLNAAAHPRETAASDEWFALGARLLDACRRLGSAEHVLREWSEPSDERADLDDLDAPGDARLDPHERARRRAARAGRRNTRLWDPV